MPSSSHAMKGVQGLWKLSDKDFAKATAMQRHKEQAEEDAAIIQRHAIDPAVAEYREALRELYDAGFDKRNHARLMAAVDRARALLEGGTDDQA